MIIFGFIGYSGAGKTTLIEALLPRYAARGLSVSVIKQVHHGFDLDREGKDSWRHRQAGAAQVMLVSDTRWVLMHELRGAPEPSLEEQVKRLSPCDLVLVEGFKHAAIPKLEVHRPSLSKPFIWTENPHVLAVASDTTLAIPLPVFDLNGLDAIARFVLEQAGISPAARSPAVPNDRVMSIC